MASRVESKPHCHCTAHGCADVVSCMPEEGRGIAQKKVIDCPKAWTNPGICIVKGEDSSSKSPGSGPEPVQVPYSACTVSSDHLSRLQPEPDQQFSQPCLGTYDAHCSIAASQPLALLATVITCSEAITLVETISTDYGHLTNRQPPCPTTPQVRQPRTIGGGLSSWSLRNWDVLW